MTREERIEQFTAAALTGIMAHGGLVQRGPDAVATLALGIAKATADKLEEFETAPAETKTTMTTAAAPAAAPAKPGKVR